MKPSGRWFAVFLNHDQCEPRLFAEEVVEWVAVEHKCDECHPPTLLPYCIGPTWDAIPVSNAGNLVGVFHISKLPQQFLPQRMDMEEMAAFAKIVTDSEDAAQAELGAEAVQAYKEHVGEEAGGAKVINLGLARFNREHEGNSHEQ